MSWKTLLLLLSLLLLLLIVPSCCDEDHAHFAWPRQHPFKDAHALDFRTDASHFVC